MKGKAKKEKEVLLPAIWEHDFFFGHEGLEASLVERLTSPRLHHAWLIEGLQGIGKATLAWRMARFLLAPAQDRQSGGLGIKTDSDTWHLTKAESHPDFLYLAPDENSASQTITIDNIRRVNDFFTKSPAVSPRRVVIIDAVENMNSNAANGLLKILEEPPPYGIIFLINHRVGSALATISSRCQKLKLSPLTPEAQQEALATFMPELSQEALTLALSLSDGSLGQALECATPEGLAIYQALHAQLKMLGNMSGEQIEKFSSLLKDKKSYKLFCFLMLKWCHALATQSATQSKKGVLLWDKFNDLIRQAEIYNLDRKLTTHNMFLAIEKIL